MLILILFLLLSAGATIGDCTVVTSPGNYELTNDIKFKIPVCISVRSKDVLIDCRGHSIYYVDVNLGEYRAFDIGADNVTIRNCVLKNATMYIEDSRDVNISNVNFTFFFTEKSPTSLLILSFAGDTFLPNVTVEHSNFGEASNGVVFRSQKCGKNFGGGIFYFENSTFYNVNNSFKWENSRDCNANISLHVNNTKVTNVTKFFFINMTEKETGNFTLVNSRIENLNLSNLGVLIDVNNYWPTYPQYFSIVNGTISNIEISPRTTFIEINGGEKIANFKVSNISYPLGKYFAVFSVGAVENASFETLTLGQIEGNVFSFYYLNHLNNLTIKDVLGTLYGRTFLYISENRELFTPSYKNIFIENVTSPGYRTFLQMNLIESSYRDGPNYSPGPVTPRNILLNEVYLPSISYLVYLVTEGVYNLTIANSSINGTVGSRIGGGYSLYGTWKGRETHHIPILATFQNLYASGSNLIYANWETSNYNESYLVDNVTFNGDALFYRDYRPSKIRYSSYVSPIINNSSINSSIVIRISDGDGLSRHFINMHSNNVSAKVVIDWRVSSRTLEGSQVIAINNIFNITQFANQLAARNYLNQSKTPGINIIGGPYLGGNFWANPKGTGFSETCDDNDNDGICDDPYLGIDGFKRLNDYYPLTFYTPPNNDRNDPPSIEIISPHGTYNSSNILFHVYGTDDRATYLFCEYNITGKNYRNSGEFHLYENYNFTETLNPGTYTFDVICDDGQGKYDSNSSTFEIIVPNITITGNPSNNTTTNNITNGTTNVTQNLTNTTSNITNNTSNVTQNLTNTSSTSNTSGVSTGGSGNNSSDTILNNTIENKTQNLTKELEETVPEKEPPKRNVTKDRIESYPSTGSTSPYYLPLYVIILPLLLLFIILLRIAVVSVEHTELGTIINVRTLWNSPIRKAKVYILDEKDPYVTNKQGRISLPDMIVEKKDIRVKGYIKI